MKVVILSVGPRQNNQLADGTKGKFYHLCAVKSEKGAISTGVKLRQGTVEKLAKSGLDTDALIGATVDVEFDENDYKVIVVDGRGDEKENVQLKATKRRATVTVDGAEEPAAEDEKF